MNMTKTMIDDAAFETLFIDHPLYQMTPVSFSLAIEKLVKEEKLDYLDATCQLCEKYEIEYSAIPRLLTPTMKDKIEVAATERKFRIGK
jgi:hypothetical protein